MNSELSDRRRWSRMVLTLPPDLDAALRQLAKEHYRDGKREALRILTEGVAREMDEVRS